MRKAILGGMLAIGSVPAYAAATESEPARITIRFSNVKVWSAGTIKNAKRHAGYILRSAGIAVTWEDCTTEASPLCSLAPGPGDLRFSFVEPRVWKGGEWALGFAVPANYSAAVVYPEVRATAEQLNVEEGVILGAVIAHEVGHLSGLEQHTMKTIMAPLFERKDLRFAAHGGLLFTRAQAQRMRAYIVAGVKHPGAGGVGSVPSATQAKATKR